MIEQKCKICKKFFKARKADINRGWAKCCSKRCAAILRESKKPKKKRNYYPSFYDEDEGFLPFYEENMEH